MKKDLITLTTVLAVALVVGSLHYFGLTKPFGTKTTSSANSENLATNPDSQPNNENTQKPTATNTPTPTPRPKQEGIQRFLLMGDSMMLEGFGPELEKEIMTYKNVDVIRSGQYSTGLNRIDYFDWYQKAQELIEDSEPDVVIVMYGANDGQDIKDESGVAHQLKNDSWDEVYKRRVERFADLLEANNVQAYWVGHPIPGNEDFHYKFTKMNRIYSDVLTNRTTVRFINPWDRFAVDGKYAPRLANDAGLVQSVKGKDGVHLTIHGAQILSTFVMKDIAAAEGLEK